MTSSSRTPIDAFVLHSGPTLRGAPEPVDAELLRHTLGARSQRPRRGLLRFWRTAPSRLSGIPTATATVDDAPIATTGPIRAESALRATRGVPAAGPTMGMSV
jgi:hypothetical protein